ncbi:hypothetical protein HanLR1_Chr04g0122051 [Helianthus annuus]|nr:hypothetical protein HanHA89_Chr04g0129981 [Helianthus annuus]KAJ0755992.1 hypothetical protein HanLR1_Chr04g0122051 [Helianthus annuus]
MELYSATYSDEAQRLMKTEGFEDSTLQTSSTSKGESVSVFVCQLRLVSSLVYRKVKV